MKKLLNLIFMAVMIISADTFGQIPIPQIIGNNNDCDDATYTVANPNALYTYTWTLSQGGTISSGNGTSAIYVKFTHITGACNYAVLSCTTSYQGNTSVGTMYIYPCCMENATYTFNNYSTTYPLIIPINSTVIINGDFIMNHNVSFYGSTVHVSPNSKIKLINNDITLTVDNSTISSNIDCCTDMWDGIYTNSPTQNISIVNGSTITNAQNALNLFGGTGFLVENSTFEDNYKNIYIYQGSGGGTPTYPGVIRNTNFFGNLSLPYPPYQGVQTYSGVEVFRTDKLTIGDASSTAYTNYFRTMFSGIKCEQSNVNIYNNVLSNINAVTTPAGSNPTQQYNSTAIFCVGNATYDPNGNLWQGAEIGGSGLKQNSIIRCFNGIYAFNVKLQADNNSVLTENYGIEGKDLYDYSYINNNTITGNAMGTFHTREGVRIANIQPRRCNLRVFSNTINAINRGIMITNANSMPAFNLNVQVYSNIVLLDGNLPPNSGKPNSAIKAANCIGINIYDNNLSIANYAAAVDNLFYGIDIAQTPDAYITNNPNINKYGAGINVYGNCNITRFYCNVLNQCYNGFLFNTQSTITSQGEWDVINTDNVWLGNYNFGSTTRKLWANQTLIPIASVRWFVQNSPPTSMQIQNTGNPTQSLIAQFINTPNAISSCMSLPTFASIAASEREALYGKIVRDSNAYTDLETQYKTYDKEVLYKNLKENPALMNLGETTDVLYQDFYAEEAAGNIGKIDAIEEFIKNNQDSLAMIKNATLQDEKQIDYFRKVVNEIYLNSFAKGNYDLTLEQTAILMPIATQYTPWEGGDAVYIARLMLNIDEDAIEVDFAKAPKSDIANSKTNSAKLYPNPASNEVMIEFDNALEANAILEIYNFAGIKIQNVSLSSGYQFVSVSTKDLKSGIYFYRILLNSNVIAKDRLLIVK